MTYDDQFDALAIQLASADVEETKDLAPGVFVDYDYNGRVLSLEILGASEKYDLDWRSFERPDPYYSLSEAGLFAGLSPTTLRHQIQRGVLPGKKIGRNWVVHWDHFDEYIRNHSRKVKGRRKAFASLAR